ncbi:hypothetical protein WMY93_028024 [Mugilogobius chulae]|uniref:Uncharacterized protein n=1 Tax=Mugilogobius chulae TaxID=88201 RepID=A0AAW0MVP0_9GOBI
MLGAVNHNATTTDKRIGVWCPRPRRFGRGAAAGGFGGGEESSGAHSLLDDDEDFAADEASGDSPSGEDGGSAPWPAPVSRLTDDTFPPVPPSRSRLKTPELGFVSRRKHVFLPSSFHRRRR